MTQETDVKVALSLLEEVNEKVQAELSGRIVTPIYDDYEDYNNPLKKICGEMVKQCHIAEKKAPANKDVLIRSNLLKAQIHANWIGANIKSGHKDAQKCYDTALSLLEDGDSETEALIRYRYGMFCAGSKIAGREKAIQNLKRAMEIVGEDSEHGIECAKEIAKLEEKKGGCFIATAVYGSYSAPDVLMLRAFRDNILLPSRIGKIFVHTYYLISPPLAKVIATKPFLRKVVRNVLIQPIVNHCRSWINGNLKEGADDFKR